MQKKQKKQAKSAKPTATTSSTASTSAKESIGTGEHANVLSGSNKENEPTTAVNDSANKGVDKAEKPKKAKKISNRRRALAMRAVNNPQQPHPLLAGALKKKQQQEREQVFAADDNHNIISDGDSNSSDETSSSEEEDDRAVTAMIRKAARFLEAPSWSQALSSACSVESPSSGKLQSSRSASRKKRRRKRRGTKHAGGGKIRPRSPVWEESSSSESSESEDPASAAGKEGDADALGALMNFKVATRPTVLPSVSRFLPLTPAPASKVSKNR